MLQFVRNIGMTHELNRFEDLSKVHVLFANYEHHFVERVGSEPIKHRSNVPEQIPCRPIRPRRVPVPSLLSNLS